MTRQASSSVPPGHGAFWQTPASVAIFSAMTIRFSTLRNLLRDTLQDLRAPHQTYLHILLAEVPVRCGALGRDIFKIISPERGLRGLVKIPDMIQPRPVTPAGVLQAHTNRMLDPGLKRRPDKVRGSDVRNRLSSRVAVHRLHFIARHGKD
jgi:hypothetical protein